MHTEADIYLKKKFILKGKNNYVIIRVFIITKKQNKKIWTSCRRCDTQSREGQNRSLKFVHLLVR